MKSIRYLGIALALALSIGASCRAASAPASYLTAATYPATIEGVPFGEGSSQRIILPANRSFNCSGFEFGSELTGPTDTLSPEYWPASASCQAYTGEGSSTLSLNKCGVAFHPDAETSPGNYSGTMEIGPTECGSITLKGESCKRSFAPQTIPATFHNEGSGASASTIISVYGSIAYTVTEGPAWFCGWTGTQYGIYEGAWQASALGESGNPVAVSVADHPAVGLFITGEAGNEPRVEGEYYPAAVDADQNPADKYKLSLPGNRFLSCEEASLGGTLSESATQLGLTPTFQGCTMTIFGNPYPTTASVNGCHYGLNVLDAGPPYSGSLDIVCSNEGDGIEIKTYETVAMQESGGTTMCTYKISPQSGLQGVGLETVGSGSSRSVDLDFALEGVSVTRLSGALANCGAKNAVGTITGSGTLLGQL